MVTYRRPTSPPFPDDRAGGAGRAGARAIGPAGTAARIVVGLVFVLLGLLIDGDGIEWTALVAGLAAVPVVVGLQLLRLSFAGSQLRLVGPVATCVNLAVAGAFLATPATSHATFVFLGASMLVAAWHGYAGCETLAVSNWLLGRDDQVGCVLFAPVDYLEARLRRDQDGHSLVPVRLALKFAGCAALVALLAYLAR